MSLIITELERRGINYFILHTGQHYSYGLDRVFFEQLQLPKPRYNIHVGSGTHAQETGKMLVGIERILQKERPDAVLVEGDTNSVLSGALVASKLLIWVGHVEAGLRSFDRTMPEEINRVVTDSISDCLFAPTENARLNLLREGVSEGKIFLTGNTIVDVIQRNLELVRDCKTLSDLKITDDYFLATLHRQENVDDPVRLRNIVEALGHVAKEFRRTVIFPMHPRTRKRLRQYRIRIRDKRIRIISPVDYLTFLGLESKADLILTDSGGVQEEACVLRVPCVTLRCNTERPETIEVGANMLAGTSKESIVEKVSIMTGKERKWTNPFGDGKASERIVGIVSSF